MSTNVMTLSITVTGYEDTVSRDMTKLDELCGNIWQLHSIPSKETICYQDFLKFEVHGKIYGMKHGTFRNKITKLRKKGEVESL